MKKYFMYNTNPIMTAPAPLYTSNQTINMIAEAKSKEDSTYWETMRKVFEIDLQNLPMERFKVWGSCMSVPIVTRIVHANYIRVVLNEIEINKVAAEAIKETGVGLTADDYNNVYKLFHDIYTNMNRVLGLGHLVFNGWMQDISKLDTIVEIGAGIGDLADIVYKLGFKGKYVIYDFPELLQIQKWYHNQLGHTNIQYVSNLDELVPADLCIATWSFTEMPLDLREQVMQQIGNTKNWLLAYSNQIFGLDNHKYITEDFLPRFPGHTVKFTDIPSMPWDGGTKYLSVKM